MKSELTVRKIDLLAALILVEKALVDGTLLKYPEYYGALIERIRVYSWLTYDFIYNRAEHLKYKLKNGDEHTLNSRSFRLLPELF